MEDIEGRLAEIRGNWQVGKFLGDGDLVGWLIMHLEASLKREAEYKNVLERLMAGVK